MLWVYLTNSQIEFWKRSDKGTPWWFKEFLAQIMTTCRAQADLWLMSEQLVDATYKTIL
jgi:hypothetical protein